MLHFGALLERRAMWFLSNLGISKRLIRSWSDSTAYRSSQVSQNCPGMGGCEASKHFSALSDGTKAFVYPTEIVIGEVQGASRLVIVQLLAKGVR